MPTLSPRMLLGWLRLDAHSAPTPLMDAQVGEGDTHGEPRRPWESRLALPGREGRVRS